MLMTPLSMPVISARATMRLTPSLCRTNWMTTSKDELIIWRMAFSWMVTPEREIMVSRRRSASRAALAWTVVMEPSCPVFMAWSMSMTSAPRTSPTMTRSGLIRKQFFTNSRLGDLAFALDVGRSRFQPAYVLLLQLQFGGIFDGDDALRGGNET